MPSTPNSHISCQAQPNINQQANTFLDMFAYTTIKFRKNRCMYSMKFLKAKHSLVYQNPCCIKRVVNLYMYLYSNYYVLYFPIKFDGSTLQGGRADSAKQEM